MQCRCGLTKPYYTAEPALAPVSISYVLEYQTGATMPS